MRDNKLHTPEGMRDLLPNEYTLKSGAELAVKNVFLRYGYRFIKSPTLEYIEVFENKGGISANNIYKFIDRDGAVIALCPDRTPAVIRIASTHYQDSELPLRLCYNEETFRACANFQGKLKENTQMGVELIAPKSAAADAEVIAVAINGLLAAGLSEFKLDIASVDFISGLLDEASITGELRGDIMHAISRRDYVLVNEAINGIEMPERIKSVLEELPLLTGGIEVIERVRGMVENPVSRLALDELSQIYNILCEYGFKDYLLFDLGMLGYLDYYTGIIFRGYSDGAGTSVLDGGRYDSLGKHFGKSRPAIGFAIKIDILVNILSRGIIFTGKMFAADTLLSFTHEARALALATGDELRSQGLSIENMLTEGCTYDESVVYAKNRGMNGILHFENDNVIRLFDLKSGDESTVTLEELLNGTGNGLE